MGLTPTRRLSSGLRGHRRPSAHARSGLSDPGPEWLRLTRKGHNDLASGIFAFPCEQLSPRYRAAACTFFHRTAIVRDLSSPRKARPRPRLASVQGSTRPPRKNPSRHAFQPPEDLGQSILFGWERHISYKEYIKEGTRGQPRLHPQLRGHMPLRRPPAVCQALFAGPNSPALLFPIELKPRRDLRGHGNSGESRAKRSYTLGRV